VPEPRHVVVYGLSQQLCIFSFFAGAPEGTTGAETFTDGVAIAANDRQALLEALPDALASILASYRASQNP
jgi:hypothetical protein